MDKRTLTPTRSDRANPVYAALSFFAGFLGLVYLLGIGLGLVFIKLH